MRSSMSCRGCQFYWWREPEYQLEKTIRIPGVIDELDHIKYEKKLATDENQTHNFSDHSKRGYFYTFGIVSTIFNFKLSPTIWLDISTYHIGIVSAISV